MKLPLSSSSESTVLYRESSAVKVILDYRLSYANMEILISDGIKSVYPRTGFLIFFFVTGTDYESRLLNYNLSDSQPFHLYITGLFSEGAVFVKQKGKGGGCSLKIHPVIGYYLLKTPLNLLTNHQIQMSHVIDREALFLRSLEADHQIDSFSNPYFADYLRKILPEKSSYQHDPIYHAVNTIIRQKGQVSVKGLAAKYHMSERTLRRQFLLKVGLSVQAYAKIW